MAGCSRILSLNNGLKILSFVVVCTISSFYLFESDAATALRPNPLRHKLKYYQHIIPVLHNLKPTQALEFYEKLLSRPVSSSPNVSTTKTIVSSSDAFCFTVSLRHDLAMQTIATLKEINTNHHHNQTILFSNKNYSHLILGASTVETHQQVRELYKLGIDFISTISYTESVVQATKNYQIPLICGVSTYQDASTVLTHSSSSSFNNSSSTNNNSSINNESSSSSRTSNNHNSGSSTNSNNNNNNNNSSNNNDNDSSNTNNSNNTNLVGLKFYPSTQISPLELKNILSHLHPPLNSPYLSVSSSSCIVSESNSSSNNYNSKKYTTSDEKQYNNDNNDICILIAGGITPTTIPSYLSAGATHFCIGFDCAVLNAQQIVEQLDEYTQAVTQALQCEMSEIL